MVSETWICTACGNNTPCYARNVTMYDDTIKIPCPTNCLYNKLAVWRVYLGEDPYKEKPPELEVGINWCVREIRDLKERVEKRESEQGSVNQRMYLALKDSIGRLSDDIVTLASDQVHTEEEVKKHGRLLKYIQDGMRGIQL